jgi:hypothetical protein
LQGLKPHLVMVFFWSIYNIIPPLMFIAYSMCGGKTAGFERFVALCCVTSYVVAAGGWTSAAPRTAIELAFPLEKLLAACFPAVHS